MTSIYLWTGHLSKKARGRGTLANPQVNGTGRGVTERALGLSLRFLVGPWYPPAKKAAHPRVEGFDSIRHIAEWEVLTAYFRAYSILRIDRLWF